MRLATFNILHGRSTLDGRVDVDRFAEAVAALDADLLALQEVDRDQPRSHGVDLTAVAAGAMGAADSCFAPALSGLPGEWHQASGDEPPGTPQYGVALLSRHPVLEWELVRLPALPGRVPVVFPRRRWPELVKDEPRVAVQALVDAPGGPVTAVSTHLSFIPWWNIVQLRRLARSLRGVGPLVLMGDLNTWPDRIVRTTRLQSLAAGLTFPVHEPIEQIDHLLARDVVATAPAVVHELPLSDHRALSVEVEVSRTRQEASRR